MLSCKQIAEQGTDYLDKELNVWKKAEMRMHLIICVNCRNYVRQLKQTILMLRGIKTKQPSDEQLKQLKLEYQEVIKE